MTGRVAVVGASGKTGRAVVAALARRGAETVPIGRAQWSDLAGAMQGCDAVHVVAPNMHEDEPAFATEVLAAARTAGVSRVGYHSVAAPYAPRMPHHLGKARTEDVVRRTAERWTILQPCAYVQNFVPALQAGGSTLEVPYRVDRPFGLVDLEDVAEATATVLLDPGHEGATYELGGPAAVTVEDVAAAASDLLGRPIEAVRIDPDHWASGPGSGLDPRVRDWLLAMFASYDECGLPTGPVPLGALLGRTPRSLADCLRACLAGTGPRS